MPTWFFLLPTDVSAISVQDPKGLDKAWQDWAVRYMANHSIGVFYFALNPGSTDTGGLLQVVRTYVRTYVRT